MTLKTELIGKVKDILPYGSIRLIQQRLAEKDIPLSYQYVWRCLNVHYDDENFDVMHEASLLSEEIFEKKAEQRRMINILHDKKFKIRKVA